MARISKRIIRKKRSLPWLGFARFLFIVVLTVLLFVLVNSMVRHHFFSGGSKTGMTSPDHSELEINAE